MAVAQGGLMVPTSSKWVFRVVIWIFLAQELRDFVLL